MGKLFLLLIQKGFGKLSIKHKLLFIAKRSKVLETLLSLLSYSLFNDESKLNP